MMSNNHHQHQGQQQRSLSSGGLIKSAGGGHHGPPAPPPPPLATSMKGRIASRAHSFKEGILEAFGHHTANHQQFGAPQGQASPKASSIQLAKKKTHSTDNLIGYSSSHAAGGAANTSSDTDKLLKEVHLALGYFEGAVDKGTYELLPGCASVVLERVVGVQAFFVYEEQQRQGENPALRAAVEELHRAIGALFRWSDQVIITGTVEDATEDYKDRVTEPVRKAVKTLVEQLNKAEAAAGKGKGKKASSSLRRSRRKKLQLHNSLPDITSPDGENPHRPFGAGEGDHIDGRSSPPPPPLPPKHHTHMVYCPREPTYGHADWFSNPLFDQGRTSSITPTPAPVSSSCSSRHHRTQSQKHHSSAGKNSCSRRRSSQHNNTSNNNNGGGNSHGSSTFTFSEGDLPSPHGLDTTLPDTTSFPFADDEEDIMLASSSEASGRPPAPPPSSLSEDFSDSRSVLPSASTCSSIGSLREAVEGSEKEAPPPALPRKEGPVRKKSQYDNVWDSSLATSPPPPTSPSSSSVSSSLLPPSAASRLQLMAGQLSRTPNNTANGVPQHPPHLHHPRLHGRGLLASSQSFDSHHFFPSSSISSSSGIHAPLGYSESAGSASRFGGPGMLAGGATGAGGGGFAGAGGGGIKHNTARRSSMGSGAPPPLPPKKRDIINYMEMLGQSLLPSREEFLKSIVNTQVLLQNVWADNYHEFGEFNPDNHSFNFPASQSLFTANMDLSRLKFSEEEEDAQQAAEEEEREGKKNAHDPPALPPKKGKKVGGGNKERVIPIVRETDGSIITPASANNVAASSSSASSSRSHSLKRNNGSSKEHHHHPHHAAPGHATNASLLGGGGNNHSIKRFSTESVASSTNSTNDGISESSSKSRSSSSQAPATQLSTLPPPPPLVPASSLSSTPSTPSAASVASSSSSAAVVVAPEEASPLNRLHCGKWETLIYANNSEGILELRAGEIDELLILATQSTNRDFVFQDAFLLTYRTFIPTLLLLGKLEYRFRKFYRQGMGSSGGGSKGGGAEGAAHMRAARCAFSLLVRVVDSLIDSDLHNTDVVENLSEFTAELVNESALFMARALRTTFIQKYEEHRARMMPDLLDLTKISLNVKPPPSALLHYKSSELAEQITLMDAAHFWKLEPAELLLWVKEQNEEKSPNLVRFTKHFNAMSYWCRTVILLEKDPKERERLSLKFIKVMKALRKHNNFNSYLAFLSALDSASIRRLEWSRTFVDTIKEYSAIIDFSGSFKAYREALSRSSSPVIPYMGLVLQDLTFVHIGNSDSIKDRVNFAKRWQQFNILDNLRRFKRQHYSFARREEICALFGNFEESLSENELWELSEKLKPRHRSASPVKEE